MITREQIEEIQAESRKKGITIKQVLEERGIPAGQYFRWRRKYSRADIPEGFVPIAGGGLPVGMAMSAAPAVSKTRQKEYDVEGNWMTIDLRWLQMFVQGRTLAE